MRLASFKAHGFKSFADPVLFKVSGELTGVVGPNGSGKSNVVDAVRWVLGESRASSLRGSTLADVMFNGSEKRQPADWCEVELCFTNSADAGSGAGGMWAAYPEIVIRRELSRDGRQAYMINGSKVRRRDVVDLFRGTGVAPRAYGVVEQGMVTHIAEASPDELRLFMEEAAGVSHYKERRRDSERRLAASNDNLAQLRLVIDGIEKQIESLRRQAKTARRHREFTERIGHLDALLILSRRAAADTELAESRTQLQEKENRIKALQGRQEKLTARITVAKTERSDMQVSAEQARQRLTEAEQALAAAEQNWHSLGENRDLVRIRLSETEQELSTLAAQRLQQKEEAHTLSETQQQIGAQLTRDAADGETEKTELERLQTEREAAQVGVDNARDRLTEIDRHIETATVRRQMVAERLADVDKRMAEAVATAAALPPDEAVDEITGEEQAVTAAEAQLTAARARHTAAVEAAEKAAMAMREQQSRLAALTAEMSALNSLLPQEEEGKIDSKRLAQVLQVDAGEWSRALDAALGAYSAALAVDDIAAYQQTHELTPGRAVIETAAEAPAAEAAALGLPLLLDRLKIPAKRRAAMNYWLADVYVAEDDTAALAQRGQLERHQRIVTRAGVVYGAHSLLASGEARGGYDWQQRMRDLEQRQTEQQQENTAAAAASDEAHRIAETKRADVEQREQALGDVRQVLAERRIEQNRLLEQRRVRQQRYEELQQIQKTLREEQERFTRESEQLDESLHTLRQQQPDAAALFTKQKNDLTDALSALERCRNQQQENDLRRREREQQVRELERQRQALEDKQRDSGEREELLKKRLQEYRREMEKHDESTLQQVLSSCRQQMEQSQKAVDEINARQQALEDTTAQLEEQREGLHNEREAGQQQLAEARLREREQALKTDYLTDALEELGLSDQQLAALQEENKEGDIARWQQEIDTLRGKRDRLGAINFIADSELREQEGKTSELTEQKTDIEKAIADLQSTILRIDSETQSRLQTMFESVNEQFSKMYQKIAGGGEAQLVVTGDAILESGFELKVRPPGKRLFPVRMLSGGEKAAAAVAFIFAIIRLNPPPFCILDEVDAPLDDDRSQRFVELLQDISHTVQCLVITHNKGTISSLPRLIGVTQEEAGASKVVSVTLPAALRAAGK